MTKYEIRENMKITLIEDVKELEECKSESEIGDWGYNSTRYKEGLITGNIKGKLFVYEQLNIISFEELSIMINYLQDDTYKLKQYIEEFI